MQQTIKIKPLSVNRAWQGRRFKTGEYEDYERDVLYLLPRNFTIPKGQLKVVLLFGVSNKSSDVDNLIKPFLDILQKKYRIFNDKNIYELYAAKKVVKKGQEFVEFEIEKIK